MPAQKLVRLAGLALAALTLSPLTDSTAMSAEIKGQAFKCSDADQMCFWHKAIVAPPTGWSEDAEWSAEQQTLILLKDGDKGDGMPLMYVRTHRGDAELPLPTYIETAQRRWKDHSTDSTIQALPDLARQGRPGFKIFLYENPSDPIQAFELTAFMKDVDSANPTHTYFFQAVLVAPSAVQLESAKSAFYELLGRL